MVTPIDQFLQRRRNDVSLTPGPQAPLSEDAARSAYMNREGRGSAPASRDRITNTPGEITGGLGRLALGGMRGIRDLFTDEQGLEDSLQSLAGVQSEYNPSLDFSTITDREVTGFGNFLTKMQSTPEEWYDFTQVSPANAELMWVQDQLSRLGSSGVAPGNTTEEILDNSKFRLERLLQQDSTGNSLAQQGIRAGYNPAVAIDIAATLAGSGFLAHELAGSLVLGYAGQQVGQAIGGDEGGRQGEQIGSFMGQFVAGVPKNPTRLYDGVQIASAARRLTITNPRIGRGMSATTGADFWVEEAKDMLSIAKGGYKIAGVSYNALNGVTKSTAEITKLTAQGVATRASNVKRVLGNVELPVGTADAHFDVSGEGFSTPSYNIFEVETPFAGSIPRDDDAVTESFFVNEGFGARPSNQERFIDDIISEAGGDMDLADRMVSQDGVEGFIPKHNANLRASTTRSFYIVPEGQKPPTGADGSIVLDGTDWTKIRVDKVEGRRADGTPLFLRNLNSDSFVVGIRLQTERKGQAGANVYRLSIDGASGTAKTEPLTRDNVMELADQMFESMPDADALEMLSPGRTRANQVIGNTQINATRQQISRRQVDAYRNRRQREVTTQIEGLSEAELIKRARLTRFGMANSVWRNAVENTAVELELDKRGLVVDSSSTKQTDAELADEYVELIDQLDDGRFGGIDEDSEARLGAIRKEATLRGIRHKIDEAARNSPRERDIKRLIDMSKEDIKAEVAREEEGMAQGGRQGFIEKLPHMDTGEIIRSVNRYTEMVREEIASSPEGAQSTRRVELETIRGEARDELERRGYTLPINHLEDVPPLTPAQREQDMREVTGINTETGEPWGREVGPDEDFDTVFPNANEQGLDLGFAGPEDFTPSAPGLAEDRAIPTTFEEVARDYPLIPTSELDNAADDIHITEAAARLPALDGQGEVPPRMPGDPVGSSPAGDSGPPAQSTWDAVRDALDIPSWEDYSKTFARWWEGARNTESIRIMANFDNIDRFTENPTWYSDLAREMNLSRIGPDGKRLPDGPITATDVVRMSETNKKLRPPFGNRRKMIWNRDSALPIFRALHVENTNKHWLDLTPDQRLIAEEIKQWKISEENDMFRFLTEAADADAELWRYDMENFATQMMAHPNYFPRGWKRVSQKHGKSIADMSATERKLVSDELPDYTPQELEAMRADRTVGGASGSSFKRGRNKYSFDEMISFDFEPTSWNPIAMMAQRRLAGTEYREMINLVTRLKKVGRVFNNVQEDRPRGSGFKQPNHPIFEARRGFTSPNNPADTIAGREGLVVEDWVANWIDKNFGVSTWVSRSGVKKWSNRAKSIKLISSAFQHVDIMSRVAFNAFAPMNTWSQARNGQFPIVRIPALLGEVMKVVIVPGSRRSLKKSILTSDKEIGNTGIKLRDVLEAGWETRGDLSVRNELSNFTSTKIFPQTSGKMDIAATPIRAMKKINEFWQSGLFEGLYTAAQKWSLENFIVPSIKAQHPEWTKKVVAAQAAETVNIMFSSLGSWQTATRHLSPGTQDVLQAMIFSTGETEGLLRGAMRAALPRVVSKDNVVGSGAFKGQRKAGTLSTTPGGKERRGWSIPGTNSKLVMSENFKQFADYYAGAFIFLAITSNLINWAATGKPMPGIISGPTTRDDPYAPFGVGYHADFMSPQVPFLQGRNGTPVYVDLVGQMDTAFRWATDPLGATAARLNVLPRAIGNQIAGQNFMGQPAETFGERAGMFASDVGVPISGINALGALREKVPGLANVHLPSESRLGVAGQLAQASLGFNLRSEQTKELKERMGIAQGNDDQTASEVSEERNIPTMGGAVSYLVGKPSSNKGTRTLTAPAQAMAKIDLKVERGEITEEERDGFLELITRELEGAVRDSGTGGRGKGWWTVGENDVLIGWNLFKDDPRMKKALMNKAIAGGFERKLGPQ